MSGLLAHRRALGFFFVLLALLFESCTSPDAVAAFAANSEKTADAAVAVFGDIQASCVRRHRAAAPVSPVFFPSAIRAASSGPPPEIPQCAAFGNEEESLSKASAVLGAYFRAIQQLASFNTTTISASAEQAAGPIAGASGMNPTQVDSIGKLAGLLTQAFTERYRQRDLVKLLSAADPSIAAVSQGFEAIAKDYQGLLREERQSLAAQYQNVADSKAPATILLLNRAYTEDLNELERRRAAAQGFIEALHQIREGHHALAKNLKSLKGKELAVALQPYTDKLEGLLPTFAKRF